MTSHPLATALLACVALPAAAADITAVIPGPDGGWDYAQVDLETNSLFIAHGDIIGAVDLAHQTRVTSFALAHHAHAVLPIPHLHQLLVTNGDTATVDLLDTATGAVRATIPAGQKPDAAIWDAALNRAIVMNAKSGTIMVIDPATAKVTATITLRPGLEYAAIDPRGLLYVNDEDNDDMTIVDLAKAKMLARVPLPGCKRPTGMAYVPKAKRIVSSCDGVATLLDPATRKVTGSIPIGAGPDAVIGDPARGRLYIPSGDTGTLAVLEDRASGVTLLKTIRTAKGARTGACDPATGKVYLPVADLTPNRNGGKPTPVPGTFRVLVLDPG